MVCLMWNSENICKYIFNIFLNLLYVSLTKYAWKYAWELQHICFYGTWKIMILAIFKFSFIIENFKIYMLWFSVNSSLFWYKILVTIYMILSKCIFHIAYFRIHDHFGKIYWKDMIYWAFFERKMLSLYHYLFILYYKY